MHQHGPTELSGPVRGTSAWWQGTATHIEGLAEGASNDTVRMDLVERVRNEIAAGTYDSPEKWEAALDQLLKRLEID
jgi:hypothetical protein